MEDINNPCIEDLDATVSGTARGRQRAAGTDTAHIQASLSAIKEAAEISTVVTRRRNSALRVATTTMRVDEEAFFDGSEDDPELAWEAIKRCTVGRVEGTVALA